MSHLAQDQLLQAAFTRGETCRSAWQAWRANADLDTPLDPVSYRLLPFACRNLLEQGIDDPLFPKLKGLSHQNWSRNQLMLGELEGVIAQWQQAGIGALALGALGLVLQGYRALSLYPAQSCAVLVKEGHVWQALDLLRSPGWQANPASLDLRDQSTLASRSSLLIYAPAGWRLRLYWRLAGVLDDPAWQDRLWRDARQASSTNNLSLQVPAPEAQFILTALDEPYPPRPSILLPAVDLLLVLELAGEALDWQRLCQDLHDLGLVARFQRQAAYLQRVLGVNERYPGLTSVMALQPSLSDHLRDRFSLPRSAALELFPYAWVDAWQKGYQQSRSKRLKTLFQLLRHTWRLDYLWRFPWFLLSTVLLREK